MVVPHRLVVNWQPRSRDLTPLDFFLSGFLKKQVNAYKLQSTDKYVNKINAQIQTDLCGVFDNLEHSDPGHHETFKRSYIPNTMS
jgi:hypothetical protein